MVNTSDFLSVVTVLAGGVCTIGIYSFLIKENVFYRFFEHLFIGIAAGLLPIFTIRNFLWPKVFSPLLGQNTVVYPDGFIAQGYQYGYLLYLAPIFLGLLYYTLYVPKYSWLAKVIIGFSLGFSAGLSFKGFFAEMVPQLTSSFKPLVVFNENRSLNWFSTFNNTFFVLTLISVMTYFFFTIKRGATVRGRVSVFGRWVMMLCFGAFFGSTVMARMALLVERVQFMSNDFTTVIASFFK